MQTKSDAMRRPPMGVQTAIQHVINLEMEVNRNLTHFVPKQIVLHLKWTQSDVFTTLKLSLTVYVDISWPESAAQWTTLLYWERSGDGGYFSLLDNQKARHTGQTPARARHRHVNPYSLHFSC